MDWDALRFFLVVARQGRLSAAARELGVEHSTVSRRVAALEADLGVALFHRTAAGTLLTAHGKRVFEEAEAMERAAVAIRARAHATTPARGRVRVALIPELGSYWLAPALPAFHAEHPDVEVHALVGTERLDLTRGEAELAVRTPRPRQPALAATRLAVVPIGLYAAGAMAGDGQPIHDAVSLAGRPLVVYSPELLPLQGPPWFQALRAHARIALVTNSTDTLVAAVAAGAGVGTVPRFVARFHHGLVSLSDDIASGTFWLVTHPEFRRDPGVRAVSAFLKRIAGRLAGDDAPGGHSARPPSSST